MKSKQINKRLFIVTTLMLTSLTTIGLCSFSFALWSNNLTVETEITTGCLDVNFCGEYSGKSIDNLELIPDETVRVWLSNVSTIPSKFAGIENEKELTKMGIRVEHGEESDKDYLDITPEKEKANPGQAFEVNISYEQENSPKKGWTEELKISGIVKIEEPVMNLQIEGAEREIEPKNTAPSIKNEDPRDSVDQPVTVPETNVQDTDEEIVDITKVTENLSEDIDNADSLEESALPDENQ